LILTAAPSGAAVVASPGWIAGTVALPGINASDLAPAGSALIVGIGAYGAKAQSIVRLERDGTVTTLVTQLNSIGGIVYDRANDRLLFTDNGLTAPPGDAVTGDTLYQLLDPLGATSAVSAMTLELAPSGSIGFAQAVLALPGSDVLIGDASGGVTGRVVKYSAGNLTNLVTGLGFTAGLSLTLSPTNELLVGDVDGNTFVGSIERYDLSGAFLGTLIGGLSGSYDQATTAGGDLLLTGGFTGDFSSSTVVAVTPGGTLSTVATGYGFSSGIAIDGPSQQAMLLDFGTSYVDTLTPVAALTAGGSGRRECGVEFWGGTSEVAPSGKPRPRWSCVDGTACDRDGAIDGSCEFVVGTCFAVSDPRIAACTRTTIDTVSVRVAKNPPVTGTIQAQAALLLPIGTGACSAGTVVTVPARRSLRIAVKGQAAGRTVDSDALTLRCLPGA
jgi:hypothetical protein